MRSSPPTRRTLLLPIVSDAVPPAAVEEPPTNILAELLHVAPERLTVATDRRPAAMDAFFDASVPTVKLTVGRSSNSAMVTDGVVGSVLFWNHVLPSRLKMMFP